jgi:hypothetical protein
MPEALRRANAAKSKNRSKVEYVFAEQKGRMGLFIRTIGIAVPFALAAEVTDLVGGIAVTGGGECGGELRVGSGAVFGIELRPIVPPATPRAHVIFGFSRKSAEMLEAEPIEIEPGRPGALGIHTFGKI